MFAQFSRELRYNCGLLDMIQNTLLKPPRNGRPGKPSQLAHLMASRGSPCIGLRLRRLN